MTRSDLDEPLQFRISDSEIIWALNKVYEDLAIRTPSHLLDGLTTILKLNTTADAAYVGRRSTNWPDLIKIRYVQVWNGSGTDDDDYTPAKFMPVEQVRNIGVFQRGWDVNSPVVWFDYPKNVASTYEAMFIGGHFRFTTTGSTTSPYGIIIGYIKDPVDLTINDGTVVPSLPYQLHSTMVWGASAILLNSTRLNRPEWAKVKQAQYEQSVMDFLAKFPEPGPVTYVEQARPMRYMR